MAPAGVSQPIEESRLLADDFREMSPNVFKQQRHACSMSATDMPVFAMNATMDNKRLFIKSTGTVPFSFMRRFRVLFLSAFTLRTHRYN